MSTDRVMFRAKLAVEILHEHGRSMRSMVLLSSHFLSVNCSILLRLYLLRNKLKPLGVPFVTSGIRLGTPAINYFKGNHA